jgi:hypothetical protein
MMMNSFSLFTKEDVSLYDKWGNRATAYYIMWSLERKHGNLGTTGWYGGEESLIDFIDQVIQIQTLHNTLHASFDQPTAFHRLATYNCHEMLPVSCYARTDGFVTPREVEHGIANVHNIIMAIVSYLPDMVVSDYIPDPIDFFHGRGKNE